MNNLIPYLTLNGNCTEAMTFYKECLGGELNIMTFAEIPSKYAPLSNSPDSLKRVMHANLVSKNFKLFASDSTENDTVTAGNNVSLSIDCQSEEEAKDIFNKLSSGGKITMPLEDAFWGALFGMLTDKFGFNWMVNYDYAKEGK